MSEARRIEAAQPTPAGSGATIARNAFHLVTGQALTTALSIALSAALGRFLGAADFGVLFLVGSMTGFAFVAVEWGQPAYVIREVARHPGRAGELLGSALAFRTAAAAAACALTALATMLLGYEPSIRAYATIMVATYLPLSLSQTYGLVFRGRDRMDQHAAVTVLAKALTVALTIPALALGGRVLSVLLAQGAAGAAAAGAAAVLARRLRLPPARVTRAALRDLAVDGTPLVAMNVGIAAQSYLETIVLSKLAPAESVGWFGAAKVLMNGLIMPAAILATAAYPAMSRAAHDPERFRSEVRAALRPLLGLGALAAVGTFLFADVGVGLVYGRERFGPTAVLLQVFAPGMLLFFVGSLFGSVVLAAGRSKAFAAAKVASVALSTALSVALVPPFQARYGNGGIGAVLAFAVTELLLVLAVVAIVPRGTLERRLILDVGRALLAGAGTLLLFRVLPPLSPVFGIPLCVAAFGALAVAVGTVRRAELATLAAALRRRAPG